jgi:hypothetical protein
MGLAVANAEGSAGVLGFRSSAAGRRDAATGFGGRPAGFGDEEGEPGAEGAGVS